MSDHGVEYDGGCMTELETELMYSCVEWRAAEWRERTFGIQQNHDLLHYKIFPPGDLAVIGTDNNPYFPEWRERLPPGSEASWIRGTWANIPVSWRDRWTDLWIECRAAEERRSKPK